MSGRLIDVGSCRLHLREAGSGPAVLLLHSLTFDSDMWDAQVADLQEDYRVLRVDLRGHGRSEWPDPDYPTLEDLADDLVSMLDQLGIDQVRVAGLSLGGMVALRLALRHPQRVAALALLNTSAQAEEPSKRDFYHHVNEASRGKPSEEQTVKLVLSLMFSEAFRATQPETVQPFHDKLMFPGDAEGVYFVGHAVFWRSELLDQLNKITCPTAVVVADQDAAFPPSLGEAMAAALPGCRLVRLEGGHMTAVEQPGRINGVLRELFSSAGGAA